MLYSVVDESGRSYNYTRFENPLEFTINHSELSLSNLATIISNGGIIKAFSENKTSTILTTNIRYISVPQPVTLEESREIASQGRYSINFRNAQHPISYNILTTNQLQTQAYFGEILDALRNNIALIGISLATTGTPETTSKTKVIKTIHIIQPRQIIAIHEENGIKL
jgi:hypothetical protein